ncbi:MAG: hypothetical protein GXP48_05395 [Acidobacteria bacterium]|nr:hypothetical protein [Acidobacteriota bacterium]
MSTYSKRATQLCVAGAVIGVAGLVFSSCGYAAGEIALYPAILIWMFGTVYWAMAKGYHWAVGLLGASCVGILVIAFLPEIGKPKPEEGGLLDLKSMDSALAALPWTCPKCSNDNPNTTYRCQSCGHSIV